ncbi:MAG: asparagine synthetase [glutamine-hydrolyzing] 1 [Nitrospirales bacterium]|nr:MAG: asparagine synthetase [glutamine-hydrolyzing] 1 [Nitrospirales bacterium]
MCGIVGIYKRQQSFAPVSEPELAAMRDKMVHRGPDDAGIWLSPEKQIGLAHRRLSIIDLDPIAAQPMSNEDDSVWIVFNGEIYNHAPLRKELVDSGHIFKTDHSDTEVIVHGFEEWGIDLLLSKMEGDFAIAVWDISKQELYLARDKIGVKPLYFYLDDDELVFASEIKAILERETITADVDPVALYHYLSFLTTPAPLTMFANIFKLPAGTYLKFRGESAPESCRYWDPARFQESNPITDNPDPDARQKEYTKNVMAKLRDGVGKRMMADVPFGVFLSGGVDSSTNVALMSELMNRPVDTFTVGFSDYKHLNELDQARIVSEKFKTNHHEVLIDENDMRGYLDNLVESQDEPLADWVCIPLYFVSKLAKDNGVTVIQVGEGADEQFSGYASYMGYLDLYNKYWKPFQKYFPNFVQQAIAGVGRFGAGIRPSLEVYSDIITRAANGGDCFWSGAHALNDMSKNRLFVRPEKIDRSNYSDVLSMGLISEAEIDFKTAEVVGAQTSYFMEHSNNKDVLASMAFKELCLRLPELLLMRVDKITMSNSLEARVPFLDDKLVSYTMGIPWQDKVRFGEPKQILKKSVEGLLPDEIIYRKKMGFAAPMAQWLRSDFGNEVEEKILNSKIMERGFFDVAYIEGLIYEHRAGKNDYSLYIWTIYNLVAWYDFWID